MAATPSPALATLDRAIRAALPHIRRAAEWVGDDALSAREKRILGAITDAQAVLTEALRTTGGRP